MGRPRKPVAIKILEGNPGKRPLPRNEPRPTLALPEPPAHLTKLARSEWDRIGQQLAKLGLASGLDVAALTIYCEIWSRLVTSKRYVARHGATYEVRGIHRKRPEQTMLENCERQIRPYLGEFGMSPRSRANLAASIADGRQPMLPMDIPQIEDPNKPKMPATPLDQMSDEEFLGAGRAQ